MVTTHHSLHTNCRTTRRNDKLKSNRRKDKFTFQDFDEKLSSLRRKKKQEKAPPLNDSIAVDKNNKTGTNSPWSLEKASIAALYNIGKVLNYEDQIEALNKCDDESKFLSFPIPGIPDLLSILDNDDAPAINNKQHDRF